MILDTTWLDIAARGILLAVAAILWVVVLVRINGLRSLSKMTNFDFVMTVALGSLVAGAAQASDWKAFAQAMVAMAGLFLVQFLAAQIRKSSDRAEDAMQNDPVFLMRNGEFCDAALKKTRVAKSDLIAKLREANVLDYGQVRAVVLETTGDVSVLHGDHLDETLIENVKRV
ncbi:MAG: YetF domain-containing protein [Pseudomonadota bacterium]|uniref:DUF421 domain-containing protein n=1 Tax=Qipengyuania flava TaxID=192812 RepID=UPI00273E1DBE|nr:YetF domain-containing protein [Qipengyuania flava]MEC7741339.1 YetF domain-containing protein [Pseudomonadota bacterium]